MYRVKKSTQMTSLIPGGYARALLIDGLLDIVKIWLAQDDPDSPKKVANIVARTRFMSPYDLLGIKGQEVRKF